jgi:hypothetical protein
MASLKFVEGFKGQKTILTKTDGTQLELSKNDCIRISSTSTPDLIYIGNIIGFRWGSGGPPSGIFWNRWTGDRWGGQREIESYDFDTVIDKIECPTPFQRKSRKLNSNNEVLYPNINSLSRPTDRFINSLREREKVLYTPVIHKYSSEGYGLPPEGIEPNASNYGDTRARKRAVYNTWRRGKKHTPTYNEFYGIGGKYSYRRKLSRKSKKSRKTRKTSHRH